MNVYKISAVLLMSVLVLSCERDDTATQVVEIKKGDEPVSQALESETLVKKPSVSKREEIDREIRRIEEKLKDKPTVKGWTLVGDAHMHLKRYKEAAGAYNEAYMLSGQAPEPRKKLKNAMYYVGLERANAK